MAPLAGRLCTIYLGGTPTTMTGEECEQADGLIYVVVDTAKQVLDPATAITVYDGVTDESATAVIDYATGRITLAEAPAGTVSVDAKYIPLLAVSQAKSVDIMLPTPVLADITLLGDTAPRQMSVASKCSISLAHFHAPADVMDGDALLFSAIADGDKLFCKVAISTSQTLAGWFVPTTSDWKHDQMAALEGVLELEGVCQTCEGRPTTEQALFSLT